METDYLTMTEAQNFVRVCDRRGIFGIERFTHDDGKFLPDLDGIADFSVLLQQDGRKSILAARKFLDLFGHPKLERFKFVC